jgi:hypothetical protein
VGGGGQLGASQYVSLAIYKQAEADLAEFGDFLDSRSARQLAEVRLVRNQTWVGQVFDPWTVSELLNVAMDEKGGGEGGGEHTDSPADEVGVLETLKAKKEALREQIARLAQANEEAERLHRKRLEAIKRASEKSSADIDIGIGITTDGAKKSPVVT